MVCSLYLLYFIVIDALLFLKMNFTKVNEKG